MKYEIEVRQFSIETRKRRNWVEVGEKDGNEDGYGYRDEEAEEEITRTLYNQIVDEIDLVKVINAVNKEEI